MGRPKGSRNRKTYQRAWEEQQRVTTHDTSDARSFARFDHLGEALEYAANAPNSSHASGGNFYGADTLQEAISYMQRGATEAEMKPALELINKIDASFRDRETSAWLPSVQGAYPMVGDYLIGLPDSMRARKPVEHDVSPIKLVIEPIVSAGVSHHEMQMRGAAIAALVMRMTEERPVELWLGMSMRPGGGSDVTHMIRFDSTPVSLSQIVAAFTPAFARMISFTMAQMIGGNTKYTASIQWGFGRPGQPRRIERMYKVMGLSPPDVLIEGGYLPDAYMMRNDPVQWVHKQLEKQRDLTV